MVRKRKRKKVKRRRSKASRSFPRYPAYLPNRRALLQGMLEMESLADEPEFADFELDERAIDIVAKMIADADEEIKRLEEIGDEEGIDKLIASARIETLPKVVTPALKADIRRRLERLSRRLQKAGQKERADSIAALALMLDFPSFPWMLFTPLTQAFDDMVQQILSFVMVQRAIVEAAGLSDTHLTPEELINLLADPEVVSRLQEQYEADEMLREVVDFGFNRFESAFAERLYKGQVDLALFTSEELAVGIAWYEHEIDKAGSEEDDEEKIRLMIKSYSDALSYLNTSARRQRWLDRLEHARTEKTWPPDIEAGLELFSSTLSDPPSAEFPEILLLAAYIGELRQMDAHLAATDSGEVQAQEALIAQIKERLERGEEPLPE